MHEENILGNAPNGARCLVLVFILEVGVPFLKINIFQRAVSTVLAVFETLKNIDFH